MKVCTKCGEHKTPIEFSKNSRARDGLCYECKSCQSARYAAAPEKKKAASAAWRAANREKALAVVAEWHLANPDKVRAAKNRWSASHPEYSRIKNHNRRARKRDAGGKLSADLAEKLFKLQRGKCACGCKQLLGDNYHRDHIMPLALGGTNTDDNIQLLRASCNLQKHAKHPVEFMQSKGFLL